MRGNNLVDHADRVDSPVKSVECKMAVSVPETFKQTNKNQNTTCLFMSLKAVGSREKHISLFQAVLHL